MYVDRYGFDVAPLDHGLLVVAAEESDLKVISPRPLRADDLGWPVGEAALLGVHELVERPGKKEPLLLGLVFFSLSPFG